jgi:hypothetical protein
MTRKVMKLVDPSAGKMVCKVCGSVHVANIRPGSGGLYYRGSWQCQHAASSLTGRRLRSKQHSPASAGLFTCRGEKKQSRGRIRLCQLPIALRERPPFEGDGWEPECAYDRAARDGQITGDRGALNVTDLRQATERMRILALIDRFRPGKEKAVGR